MGAEGILKEQRDGRDALMIRADDVWLAWVQHEEITIGFALIAGHSGQAVLLLQGDVLSETTPPAGLIGRALQPGWAPGWLASYLRRAAAHFGVPSSEVKTVLFYPPLLFLALQRKASVVPARHKRWENLSGEFQLVADAEAEVRQ